MKPENKKEKKFVTGGIAAAGILLVVLCLILPAARKQAAYREALRVLQEDPETAYGILADLGSYRDAAEQAAGLAKQDPSLLYRRLSKGDRIIIGAYEQDDNAADGAEPVEWMVLDRIDDELLLLSVVCLDCRTYNDTPFVPVTWETSAVRSWLNGTFYDAVFSDAEKQMIMAAENRNPDQSEAGTNGGADTEDHVFLLCEKEAGIYLGDEMAQEYTGRAEATAFAVAQGLSVDEDGMAEWWLRTPGEYEYTAQFVDSAGKPYVAGAYVDIAFGIRPAIWLNAGGTAGGSAD